MQNPNPDKHMKSIANSVAREQGGTEKGKGPTENSDKNRGTTGGGNKPPSAKGGGY